MTNWLGACSCPLLAWSHWLCHLLFASPGPDSLGSVLGFGCVPLYIHSMAPFRFLALHCDVFPLLSHR